MTENNVLTILALTGGSGSGGGGSVTVDSELNGSSANPVRNSAVTAALGAKQNRAAEVTVAADGAVTQALDAGKIYHFTGALTALTVTLNAPASGEPARYRFAFAAGSAAPTVSIPAAVTMPDGWAVRAGRRYEVDILNNYGAAVSWAVSAP